MNGDATNTVADEWNRILVMMSGPPDTTAPEITAVGSTPSIVSAIVRWTTDDTSDSTVEYGPTASYGSTTTRVETVTSHSVTLMGLSQSTTYHFRVRSTNLNALESALGDFTFTTGSDVTPPVANVNRPFTGRIYVNDMETNTFSTIMPLAVGSTLTVNVFATDASGVVAVEMYVDTLATERADATQMGPTTWSWSWPIGNEAAGSHTLYAKAYDTAGNSRTVSMSVNVVPLPGTI
ncbi:MAG: fibronectin type III domain-containing protein [Euryarchaeota archaeon]|nr:fibronectin type III domain-containing protein [Euryarchaeota archaeon]